MSYVIVLDLLLLLTKCAYVEIFSLNQYSIIIIIITKLNAQLSLFSVFNKIYLWESPEKFILLIELDKINRPYFFFSYDVYYWLWILRKGISDLDREKKSKRDLIQKIFISISTPFFVSEIKVISSKLCDISFTF